MKDRRGMFITPYPECVTRGDTPSDTPDDTLILQNWTAWRKAQSVACTSRCLSDEEVDALVDESRRAAAAVFLLAPSDIYELAAQVDTLQLDPTEGPLHASVVRHVRTILGVVS